MAATVKNTEALICIDNDQADQCIYVKNNSPKDDNTEWSEEYGANFHGCLKKSKGECRAKAPEFMDCLESCSYPVLKVSLALLAILAWFM